MLYWLKNRLWPQLYGTLQEWQKDDTGQFAAALSFYTAFSFFPLLMVLLAGLAYTLRVMPWEEKNAANFLLKLLSEQVSPEMSNRLGEIIRSASTNLEQSALIGGPTGFAMLLLGALGIFANMEVAFSRIWKEYLPPPKPGFWPLVRRILFGRIKAFVVVFGLGLFALLTFLASLSVTWVNAWIVNLNRQSFLDWVDSVPILGLVPWEAWSLRLVQMFVGALLNVLLFLFLYRLFCPRRIGWAICLRGSLIAGLFWELGRIVLTWYLVRGGSYSAYGIVGSFIAMMMWFFYAWNVVFFGAEWGEVAYRLRRESLEKDRVANAPPDGIANTGEKLSPTHTPNLAGTQSSPTDPANAAGTALITDATSVVTVLPVLATVAAVPANVDPPPKK